MFEGRLQERVGRDGLAAFDAEFLEPESLQPCGPPDRHEQRVEGDALLATLVLRDELLLALDGLEAQGAVVDSQVQAVGGELLHHQRGHVLVLARQDARAHLEQRHLRAKPRGAGAAAAPASPISCRR